MAQINVPTTIPQIIDTLWQNISHQINSGLINNVRIPFIFKSIIGENGINVIMKRFERVILVTQTPLFNN